MIISQRVVSKFCKKVIERHALFSKSYLSEISFSAIKTNKKQNQSNLLMGGKKKRVKKLHGKTNVLRKYQAYILYSNLKYNKQKN